jgi:copper chaperone NosL
MTDVPGASCSGRGALVVWLAAPGLPLWEVRLGAPQYPEGLGLRIYAHTVAGIKEHDLQNINGLNHYIGMQAIEPDAIPELKYMPWIRRPARRRRGGGSARRRVRRRHLGGAVFALLGVVGLWDFWRWEYDYGHNLDMDKAIIIVPGMTYQPPLIGSKQLLNFTATAWPGTGAMALGVSFLVAAGVLIASRPRREA